MDDAQRLLSSQLTRCCYDYVGTAAAEMCKIYRHECKSGETLSYNSVDEDCSQQGLSFIDISFLANTAIGYIRRVVSATEWKETIVW
eukprot:13129624-Ditylum_brightwellii.AAC.1